MGLYAVLWLQPRAEADDAHGDEVDGHDIAQQGWPKENQDSGNQGDDRLNEG